MATQLRPVEQTRARYSPARLERCEMCHANRHVCGCEERLDYEAVRDNPTLFAR